MITLCFLLCSFPLKWQRKDEAALACFFLGVESERQMRFFVAGIGVLLACVEAYPDNFVKKSNDGGGCGVLISEVTQSGGMGDNGYELYGDATVLQSVQVGQNVVIPVNALDSDSGYFVTTKAAGKFVSEASASMVQQCDKFVYNYGGASPNSVTFVPSTTGNFSFEVAHAPAMGKIRYYVVEVQIVPVPTSAPTSNPTDSPSASPTNTPTDAPTDPTAKPTDAPTSSTPDPSASPTTSPTATPTVEPTSSPSVTPTSSPTSVPSASPTLPPSTPAPTTEEDLNGAVQRSASAFTTTITALALLRSCFS